MITEESLRKIGVLDWQTFGDTFEGSDILIGNGFSINLYSALSYTSLFSEFAKTADSKVANLFKIFSTTNFEYVMEALNNTQNIGKVLGLDYSSIAPIVEGLKVGLVKTICATHPEYKDISQEILRSLAVEFLPFRNIYTTNYDVFLYKIILANNTLIERGNIEGSEFQDEFYVDCGKHKLAAGEDFANCRKIYYLHGALFLYHERGETYKFRKAGDDDEYIRMLRIEIANGNLPLFVAEGKSDEKVMAINNNYYLRSCTEALKRRDKSSIIVYGSALQPSDNHIIGAINQAKPEILIISIYVGEKSVDELEKEISRIRGLFGTIEVVIFDSRTLFNFTSKYHF